MVKLYHFIRIKIISLYNSVSNWAIDRNSSEFEKNYTVLLNRYFFLLSIISLIQSTGSFVLLGFDEDCIFFFLMSIYWLSAMLLKEKRKNKYFISAMFVCLSLVITYYSSYLGIRSGAFLFFFPLLLGIHFLFSIKEDFRFVVPVTIFILMCFYISAGYDFKLIPKKEFLTLEIQRKSLILNITSSLLILTLNYFYGEEKKHILYQSIEKNKNKLKEIEALYEKLESLKSIISKEKFSDENITELLDLAYKNDALFLEKFQVFFPDFFAALKANSTADLIYSDLHISAMIKLNFNTKQIATYTNSTIKSVENKKYRLKKKLNIPATQELTFWISTL